MGLLGNFGDLTFDPFAIEPQAAPAWADPAPPAQVPAPQIPVQYPPAPQGVSSPPYQAPMFTDKRPAWAYPVGNEPGAWQRNPQAPAPVQAPAQPQAPAALGYAKDPVAGDLPVYARAFLNTIAGPESGGRYDIRYTPRGGATFTDLSRHPGIFEPTADGQKSSAAGRYQFTKTTWDRLGGGDFSPENQDRRAWQLAQQDFRRNTGQDLNAVLQNGVTPQVFNSLSSTWAGFKGRGDKLVSSFNDNLTRLANVNPADLPSPYAQQASFTGQANTPGGFAVPGPNLQAATPTHRQSEIASMAALDAYEANKPGFLDQMGDRLKKAPPHAWVNAANGLMKAAGGLMAGPAAPTPANVGPVQVGMHKPEGQPYGLLGPSWSPTMKKTDKSQRGLLS